MMIPFTIDYREISTDREFTTNYIYDGCDCQKGYDLIGWGMRCAEFARKNGFMALWDKGIKLVNPNDYKIAVQQLKDNRELQ